MTAIPLRLRIPLMLRTRDQALLEAATGIVMPPARVVPARTTVRVVDFFSSGAYVLLPDGGHTILSPETVREHGYIPRAA